MASIRKLYPKGHPKHKESPWVVEYTDPQTGKRRRATPKSGLAKDADALKRKIEREIEDGHHVAPSQTATVSEVIDLWLERCEQRVKAKDRLRARTLKNWRCLTEKHIRPYLGRKLLTDLTPHAIEAWVESLSYEPERKTGRPTIVHALNCLRLILADSLRRRLVARNVLSDADIRVPGMPADPIAVPTKDEVRALLEGSGKTVQGGPAPYLRPFVYMAVFSGLRLGEIRALRWENVDFQANVIRVREGVDSAGRVDAPKSRAGVRDVPIAPPLSIELKRWSMATGRPEAGLLFKSRLGGFVNESAISTSWSRLQHRVLEGKVAPPGKHKSVYHFHALRHVAASLFIETGLPPKRIQTIMGHASIQMTFDRYGHLFEDPDLMREAMNKMGAGPYGLTFLRHTRDVGASYTRQNRDIFRQPIDIIGGNLHIPMPFQFLPMQTVGLGYQVPGVFRLGGLDVRLPKEVRYLDGF